jgi:hypothetical protein
MESSDLPLAAAQLPRPIAAFPLAPPVHACSLAAAHATIKKRKRAAASSPASPAAASPTVASLAAGRVIIAPVVARRKKAAESGPKKATQGGCKKQVVKPRAAIPQPSPPVAGFAAPQRLDVGAGNVFDEMSCRYEEAPQLLHSAPQRDGGVHHAAAAPCV